MNKLRPFISKADDYHEFDGTVDRFIEAGFGNLLYREIYMSGGKYHAVFFQKGDAERATTIVNEWKKTHSDDCEE